MGVLTQGTRCGGYTPVGEKQRAFQFRFQRVPEGAFQGSRVTSDAGLILVRELGRTLGN